MKKQISTFALLLVCITTMAQFGLTVGPNFSKHRVGVEPNNKLKTSITGGVYANIKLAGWLDLQPQLIYINKGTAINREDPIEEKSERFKMRDEYIEMPVILRAGGRFRVEGGGYVAYLVRRSIGKWNYENPIKEFDEFWEKKNFNRIDYGLTGGLSYKWDWVTVAATYEHGLGFLAENGKPLNWPEADRVFKQETYKLTARFPLNGK